MFNPFSNSGLILTANLGGAQSAFHPVHSPLCRPTSPASQARSSVASSISPVAVDAKTLSTLRPLTPASSDGAPFSPTSSSLISPGSKRSPQSVCSDNITTGQSLGLCQICSDRATGKHYGANSCDGCKGFFRRTIRKDQHYACRFDRSCVIDKDKRNTCRYCRFKKCLNAGMRRDAVQNERDRISVKISNKSQDSSTEQQEILTPKLEQQDQQQQQEPLQSSATSSAIKEESGYHLNLIQQAENLFAHLRTSVISNTNTNLNTVTVPSKSVDHRVTPTRLATVNDLAEAIKQQLLLLVEWAKSLPPFYDLSLDDQVALLRAYAAEHLLLGVARRSLPFKDLLLLSNDACIPRSHSSEIHDVNRVVFRILDELVEPMRDLQLDDTEYGCLKALLFFNPSALGLSGRAKVKETRQNFLEAFNDYVTRKQCPDKVRFGNLLLLLPPLQAMSQQFIEDLQLATLFGMATFDKLLEELLLAAAEPLAAPFLTEGISAVANKMAGEMMNSMETDTGDHSSSGHFSVEMDKKLS